MAPRSIIVVTGATAGIGFGICHRLIDQLCCTYPSDIGGVASTANRKSIFSCEKLTLILPCRSVTRGERARSRLLEAAKAKLRSLQHSPEHSSHAERFVSALAIDVLYCDLASVSSVLEFGRVVSQKYPYVTHIINNAGTGSFLGIDIWKGLCEFFKNPVRAVTAPNYKIEIRGGKSDDGLGWVWQCNVFGHYVIYKSILPLLRQSPFETSRVLWMSSLEAVRDFFDPEDWQLTETETPYEGSKCQMDLISVTLDRESVINASNKKGHVRHMVIQPGVVDTDILGASQIGFVLNYLKLIAFYLARILFSQNHTITPYTAAISATFASLTPQLPSSDEYQDNNEFEPVKYSSKTRWNGEAFVARDKIDVWKGNGEAGIRLIKQMDTLYDEFCQKSLTKGAVRSDI